MTDGWIEPASKFVVYTGLLLAIGSCALRWAVVPPAAARLDAAFERDCTAWIASALMASSLVALAGLLLRVWAHTVTAFGLSDSFSWQQLSLIGFESRWGGGWRMQMVAAAALCATSVWARTHPRSGWPTATVAVLAFAVAIPFTGHAAGQGTRVALHAVHVVSAGMWAGSLMLLAASRATAVREARTELLHVFERVAIPGVACLIASGAAAAWLYLEHLSDLWRTGYGQLLTLKLLSVAGALALGAGNWRRLHRAGLRQSPRLSLFFEVALLAFAILVTAWLTETAHPS